MPAAPWQRHVTRVARAVKAGDHIEADEARRDLRADRLEARIKEVVNAAPPLTEAQRDHLCRLLTSDRDEPSEGDNPDRGSNSVAAATRRHPWQDKQHERKPGKTHDQGSVSHDGS